MAALTRHAKAPAVLGNRRNRRYCNQLPLGPAGVGNRPSLDEWLFGAATPWAGPTRVSVTTTQITSFSNPHVYQLPTLAVGDTCILVAGCLDTLAAWDPTTDMSAWTSHLASELNAFHAWRIYSVYITDAGMVTTWSGATLTFSSDNGGKGSAHAIRIAGAQPGGVTVTGPTATNSNSTPDPPSSTPSWGSADTLWIPVATFGSGGDTLTAGPANYTDATGTSGASAISVASAFRQLATATEDPGAFTLTGTENWQAATIAIQPFTGGGPVAGTTRATLAVLARITGTKVASGTARAATPTTARTTGSKTTTRTTRGTVSVTQRTTGRKIATGATRAPVPAVARTTGTKAAQGSTRATVPTTARATATKIAQGATTAVDTITAIITGTTAGGAIQGATRALATITARATGTKVAQGATRGPVPTTHRSTGTKVALRAARALVATTARTTGTKTATGSARITTPTTQRTTATRTALGALRAPATPTVRATGSKTSQGAMRGTAGPYARTTGRKIATGATRLAHTVIALITPGSQTPPLEVAHRAQASTRHHAIALELHTTEATTTHTATARRAT